ncbi:class I SAM-dependent methyltransferase [Mycobacterium sp. AT1]|uniref:class I SAM-dependent methyltransferase n=1 Tax=Mycobacterium sp. AT1 TaxID=1961706 RepID=UPI0009ABFEA8|nr:class I SAM-dependent methyltransferase [Mycobacterium sp. AT1]OPX12475.1 hypothetical protein B1790_03200 [Mycobacterium sp. AT1]
MANSPASSPKDVTRLFDVVSRGYDTPWIQRRFYQPAQDAILEELANRGSRRILDVGCGTGILTARIQSTLSTDDVSGIDPSEGMLANARRRSSAVNWLSGAAEHLPLPDGSVDAVTSSTAFHFLDQPAALAEFHRVLAPGGAVVIGSIIQPAPLPRDPCGILARCTPSGYRASDRLPNLLSEAGFHTVERRSIDSLASSWPLFYRVTAALK